MLIIFDDVVDNLTVNFNGILIVTHSSVNLTLLYLSRRRLR